MKATDHPVWQSLAAYRVGPDDAALTFEARLARENGWTAGQAERVMVEYRRFLFLAVVAGHPVTPSDAVDQAWHLHLSYSRDYWDRLCPDVLGRALHHGPTAGGEAEHQRYFDQYAQTMASYEQWFDAPPPAGIWHSAYRRLIIDADAVRVHRADHWILRKRSVRIAAMAIGMILLLLIMVSVTIVVKG